MILQQLLFHVWPHVLFILLLCVVRTLGNGRYLHDMPVCTVTMSDCSLHFFAAAEEYGCLCSQATAYFLIAVLGCERMRTHAALQDKRL